MSVIVVGGGGLGLECAHYLLDESRRLKGFLDDNVHATAHVSLGAPYLGPVDDYQVSDGDEFVVAIGDGVVRKRLADLIASRGGELVTIRHPTAYVATSATVGRHCMLAPFAFVGPQSEIGESCVLNIYSSVGHDAAVGDGVTLSPYATLNGHARVGSYSFLGTHTTVSVGKSVGEYSKLATGSVAMRDIPPRCLAVGNPARSRAIY